MSRIGGNPSGVDLVVQNQLLRNANRLEQSSLRLATLQRINRGSDDPAGLIAAESLRSQLVSLEKAVASADRAAALVRVADSGLSQVSGLLNTIRGNVVTAASSTTSPIEREALQIEIDAALEAIDRIGGSTSLGGRKLLDGSAGFDVSGVNPAQIANVEVLSRGGGAPATLDVEVIEGSLPLTADAANGTDAVVLVNGQAVEADGNVAHVRLETLEAKITLTPEFEGQADPFTIRGEALTFVLGSDVSRTTTLSLPQVNSFSLGGGAGRLNNLRSGGSASLASENFAKAVAIVDRASSQINTARARAGAFEKFTLDSTRIVLNSTIANVSKAFSQIADTDVAQESARLVQSMILVNAGLSSAKLNASNRTLAGSLLADLLGFAG